MQSNSNKTRRQQQAAQLMQVDQQEEVRKPRTTRAGGSPLREQS